VNSCSKLADPHAVNVSAWDPVLSEKPCLPAALNLVCDAIHTLNPEGRCEGWPIGKMATLLTLESFLGQS
jgi:hypothetical protein